MKDQEHIGQVAFTDRLKASLGVSRGSDLLLVPNGFFDAQSALLEDAMVPSAQVPDGFFESQENWLEHQMHLDETSNRTRRLGLVWIGLAAACVLGLVLMVYLPSSNNEGSFANQLEEASLEYDDLNEMELDESVYEEFIVEDTIIVDSVQIQKLPSSMDDFKPSKGQHVIRWDDIDADDIDEYLKEEESLNIIDNL